MDFVAENNAKKDGKNKSGINKHRNVFRLKQLLKTSNFNEVCSALLIWRFR
jgi:hypothetical protein